MLTRAQVIGLIETQKPFLGFPGVSEPYVSSLYCKHCQEETFTLRCCKSIWCPICNLKLSVKMSDYMKQIRDMLSPKYKTFMITLTFKNLHHVTSADFKNYRNIFIKKFLRSKKIKPLILGGFYSFDWTVSTNYPKDPFNIHIHLLAFTENFIPFFIVREQWMKATGDSHHVHLSEITNLNHGMKEVCKYAQSNDKLLKSDPDKREELMEAINGIRRFSKFGIAYKIKLVRGKAKCRACKSTGWGLRPEW